MSGGPRVVVRPLDDTATRALGEWLERARQLGVDPDELDGIDAAYTAYFDQVVHTPGGRREDPTMRLTTIGMVMGEHLRRRSALEWRVVQDAEGTDLALTADEHGVLFPMDPVADAWGKQQRVWLGDFVRQLLLEMDAATR